VANEHQKEAYTQLLQTNDPDKVEKVLALMKQCGADEWAIELKQHYFKQAMQHLEEVAVVNDRKKVLQALASFLIQRDY
jgi:geranylgeranyl diphosphate synthase type II